MQISGLCDVSILSDERGRPLACKTGPADRLAAEAAALAAAQGPGVVELVGYDPAENLLTTAWLPGPALDRGAMTSSENAVRLIIGVAETVNRLHQASIVHGRISSEHLIVDGERSVLLGFAAAHVGAGDPRPDVEALGRLLTTLLAVPRRPSKRGPAGIEAAARAVARRAAGQAEPAITTAAALRDELTAVLTPDASPDRLAWLHAHWPPPAPVLVALAGAAVVVSGVVIALGHRNGAVACSTCQATAVATGRLAHGPHHYRLAAGADDRVVMGDWSCHGAPTPAVLRRPSGAVEVFAQWPTDGRSTTARRIAVQPTAVDLRAEPRGHCTRLLSIDAAGHTQELPT